MGQLPNEQRFVDYKRSRTKKGKETIDKFFDMCNHQHWLRMEVVLSVTKCFRDAHKLCSGEKTPLSCYVLVVQALKNEVWARLDDEEFDLVLGDGAAQQVKDMLRPRFNMDGSEPDGTQKVGLLDKFHLWCFIVDPFSCEWRATFFMEGAQGRRVIFKEMIEHFVGVGVTHDSLLEELEVCYIIYITIAFLSQLYNHLT